MSKKILWGVLALVYLSPSLAMACACGCGVFDVGTGSMMPMDTGGTVWFEYDGLNQSQNWSGTSRASKDQNEDKILRSDFFRVGGEYMFNRSWGVMAMVPYINRTFKTTNDDGNTPTFHHSDIGDIHLQGVYSGLSDDMSTGLTFGLKLPNGHYDHNGFDRDTETGTGSTDLLLGGYHMGALTDDNRFNWFANGQYERAVSIRDHYRPGDEWDAASGIYYNVGQWGSGKIAPLLQLLGSYRIRDSGQAANPDNSGYTRLLISPGVEYDVNNVKLYGDVEVPIYQNINGNQLTAPVQFKFIVGYSF